MYSGVELHLQRHHFRTVSSSMILSGQKAHFKPSRNFFVDNSTVVGQLSLHTETLVQTECD